MLRVTLLALAVTLAVLFFAAPTAALQSVPRFTLNLDLPPQQRWNDAVDLVVKKHGWKNTFGPVLELYEPISLVVPTTVKQTLYKTLQTKFPELFGELQGIYDQFKKYPGATSLCSFEDCFVLMAWGNELEHANFLNRKKGLLPKFFDRACTGILGMDKETKSVFHQRNMDESPRAGRNATLHITALRNNTVQWTAIDWLWMTAGVETSQRQGGVSLELNFRPYFSENEPFSPLTWSDIIKRAQDPKVVPVLLLHRVVHENKMTMDTLIPAMRGEKFSFVCPFYVVSSGVDTGAIFTMHNNKSKIMIQTLSLNGTRTGPAPTNMLDNYLVQTNYDSWVKDPEDDPRRTVATDTLRMLGDDNPEDATSELTMWQAISVYPVHNGDTMYTTIMNVRKPDMKGWIRRSMRPDN